MTYEDDYLSDIKPTDEYNPFPADEAPEEQAEPDVADDTTANVDADSDEASHDAALEAEAPAPADDAESPAESLTAAPIESVVEHLVENASDELLEAAKALQALEAERLAESLSGPIDEAVEQVEEAPALSAREQRQADAHGQISQTPNVEGAPRVFRDQPDPTHGRGPVHDAALTEGIYKFEPRFEDAVE